MDLREFFDNIFNIDDTIEDLEKSFIRGNFIFDDGSLRSNIRPRDLMLKNSSTIRRSTTRNGGHHSIDNFFESFADDRQQNIGGGSIASKSQSVIKEFKSDSNVIIKSIENEILNWAFFRANLKKKLSSKIVVVMRKSLQNNRMEVKPYKEKYIKKTIKLFKIKKLFPILEVSDK